MVGAKVGGAILVLGGGGIGECDSGGGCDWLGAGALATGYKKFKNTTASRPC
jgi:hypothetical protein